MGARSLQDLRQSLKKEQDISAPRGIHAVFDECARKQGTRAINDDIFASIISGMTFGA